MMSCGPNSPDKPLNEEAERSSVPRGYVPAELIETGEGQRIIEWLDMSGTRLFEHFFSQTAGREEHCARVVGRCCAAAANALDEHALLVNYAELNAERLIEIVNFFGIEPSAAESEAIRRVSGLYSKDPSFERAFSADSDSKRAEATEDVREAAERWAGEPYRLLERLRRERASAL
jgi:hypothetical protein